MRQSGIFLALTALALAVALTAWCLSQAGSFEECKSNEQTYNGTDSTKQSPKRPIAVFAKCEAVAANENNGVLVAVATFILAFITWRLVALGIDQGDTTKKELRAHLGVQGGAIRIASVQRDRLQAHHQYSQQREDSGA